MKTPRKGQEGVHLPIEQVDALRPMRRDAQPYRGIFDHVGYGFETVQDFGKRADYQQNSPSSPLLVTRGLVEPYPATKRDDEPTLAGPAKPPSPRHKVRPE